MQPDRPKIVLPMGGVVRDGIPAVVKDAHFARRGFEPDGEDERLIRWLWSEMESVQARFEADEGDSVEDDKDE